MLWKNDGKVGTNASVTDLGAALLVVTDGGELTVQQKTGDALKELVKLKVSEAPVWAAPAVAGNHLLIKDATTLALFTIGGNK